MGSQKQLTDVPQVQSNRQQNAIIKKPKPEKIITEKKEKEKSNKSKKALINDFMNSLNSWNKKNRSKKKSKEERHKCLSPTIIPKKITVYNSEKNGKKQTEQISAFKKTQYKSLRVWKKCVTNDGMKKLFSYNVKEKFDRLVKDKVCMGKEFNLQNNTVYQELLLANLDSSKSRNRFQDKFSAKLQEGDKKFQKYQEDENEREKEWAIMVKKQNEEIRIKRKKKYKELDKLRRIQEAQDAHIYQQQNFKQKYKNKKQFRKIRMSSQEIMDKFSQLSKPKHEPVQKVQKNLAKIKTQKASSATIKRNHKVKNHIVTTRNLVFDSYRQHEHFVTSFQFQNQKNLKSQYFQKNLERVQLLKKFKDSVKEKARRSLKTSSQSLRAKKNRAFAVYNLNENEQKQQELLYATAYAQKKRNNQTEKLHQFQQQSQQLRLGKSRLSRSRVYKVLNNYGGRTVYPKTAKQQSRKVHKSKSFNNFQHHRKQQTVKKQRRARKKNQNQVSVYSTQGAFFPSRIFAQKVQLSKF